jgi:predicted deacylase
MAHYIEHVLLPLSDVVLDLHSGGSSLMYLPSALVRRVPDGALAARQLDLLKAFAAPVSYVVQDHSENRTMLAAAERAGVAALGTELGGSGTTTPASLAIAQRGVRRVLQQLGSITGPLDPSLPSTRLMEVGGSDYYVYSPEYGIWEPLVDLGDDVVAGQPAAVIHCQQTPWREPTTAHFARAGTVICRRVPGGVQRGDCLFHLATDLGV